MGDDPRFIFMVWAFIVVSSITLVWYSLTQPLPWVP
jgi:hypothetical protein